MGRIKIKDLPKDQKISKEKMKKVRGGATGLGTFEMSRFNLDPNLATMFCAPPGCVGCAGFLRSS